MGERTYTVAEPVELTREEKLLHTRRLDDGAWWEIVAVDLALLDALTIDDEPSPEIEKGLHRSDPTAPETPWDAEPPGTEVTVFPQSWSRGNCDGVGGVVHTDGDNEYWQGDDDRVEVSVNSARRKAVVEIRVDGDSDCTGTILDVEWVLTAAHCLYDDDSNPIHEDRITVKRWDGVDPNSSYDVADVRVPDTWSPSGGDPKDDYALLRLARPLMSPFFDMDISQASDTTISSLSFAYNLTFPAHAPNCDPNLNGLNFDAMWLNDSEGIGGVYAKKLHLQMDGGPGHSGSPVLYCPGLQDDILCEGDEKGFVLGLFTTWKGLETTFAGPKGPSFRDWAVDIVYGGG